MDAWGPALLWNPPFTAASLKNFPADSRMETGLGSPKGTSENLTRNGTWKRLETWRYPLAICHIAIENGHL